MGSVRRSDSSYYDGETAENLVEQYEITREEQDEVALRSHTLALKAIESGYFDDQIVPITIKERRKVVFSKDEHPRADITAEKLAGLKPAFRKDGSVTAGNASGLNDGSAVLVLMSEEKAKEKAYNR